jgi:superfamily II DNA/RNA helicase
MNSNYKQNCRLIFKDRIHDSLIGPGSDVFGIEASEEIISDYPLKRYYSGVLFPERTSKGDSIGNNDDANAKNDFSDDERKDPGEQQDTEASSSDDGEFKKKSLPKSFTETSQEDYSAANHYFPTNVGLTFCVDKNVSSIKIEFSFAKYRQLKKLEEIKIAIEKEQYEKIAFNQVYSLSEYLDYNGQFMFFKTLGSDAKESKLKRLNVYSISQIFKGDEELKNSIGLKKVELLLGRIWKRIYIPPIIKEVDISQDGSGDSNGYEVLATQIEGKEKFVEAKFYKLVHATKHGKYVKILLANKNIQPRNKFSNGNELLNSKCFFQVCIKAVEVKLKTYKPVLENNPFDDELNTINYQYRNELAFGIGHGCAVKWNDKTSPTEIETTFFPEVDISNYSNDFRTDFPEQVKDITLVRKLSIWTDLSQEQVIQKLNLFANAYKDWIETQNATAKKEKQYESIYNPILSNQEYTLKRLLSNIALLKDKKIFKCFQLANTAMLIQMILSNDNSFGSKAKELSEFNSYSDEILNQLKTFKDYKQYEPQYRPFQLAFLLLNLESTINVESNDRNNKVDMLWFPTGGGKTEAYLALTAFTIISRRIFNPNTYQGITVIMRYTLRLLTAQQFERATKLICALEFLRNAFENDEAFYFGHDKVSIGMWVGSSTTPNTYGEAKAICHDIDDELAKLNQNRGGNFEKVNSFPVTSCPWCGCNSISKFPATGAYISAYTGTFNKQTNTGSFVIKCINQKCHFATELPIYFVDEAVYEKQPTLLFATVDKFAMLSHREEGNLLFNSLSAKKLPPDLIIQDELHLLSGPLGSITGLFESIVEMLCTKGKRKPKIIASTATTRNTKHQIEMLYGNRELNIFPAPGITYDDNFFSYVSKSTLRKHIGFMPTGKTSLDSQIQLIAHLLFSRIELYKNLKHHTQKLSDDEIKELITYYWTIVSYYNSLKDVGKTYNKIGAEILTLLKLLHNRHDIQKLYFGFNYMGLPNRTRELTSRVESQKIKSLLNELSENFALRKDENGNAYIDKTVDLVLASNMFSVGIDIKRLNVMLMNGQPRNVAEYIQASSRVGRDKQGIVFNLLDANRAREKSYFESYVTFHNAYYKFVEPLSVTPFTEISLDKVLNSILICYVRHKTGLFKDKSAKEFNGNIQPLKDFIGERIKDEAQKNYAFNKLDELTRSWMNKVVNLQYKKAENTNHNLIQKITSFDDWSLMQSMREIDTNSLIKITIRN